MFKFGLEALLESNDKLEFLKTKRVSLMAHPASVNQNLDHSLDLLMHAGVKLSSAFGPQHGMRGEKQDNMIESEDYKDPNYGIPVFSLYGDVRRPTKGMMDSFDILLFDLQDVGCRIYTFLTTLFYMMDACAESGDKQIWVLDRPNPAGRPIEGLTLDMSYESFIGAAPVPMRHGLTLAEAAQWYREHKSYNIEIEVVKMEDYCFTAEWPSSLSWVNPSPNIPRVSSTKIYPGTVLLEGTNLSEGRGTTLPLEVMGAPELDAKEVISTMKTMAGNWLEGGLLRHCYFEPTFQKHAHRLCEGLQVHVDHPVYDEEKFSPYRLVALFLKSLRGVHTDFDIWRQPPYEYETVKLPFDILSGSSHLREWVDDSSKAPADLEESLSRDEKAWEQARSQFLLY